MKKVFSKIGPLFRFPIFVLGQLLFLHVGAQQVEEEKKPVNVLIGTSIGKTFDANRGFPETDPFKEVVFSLFWKNDDNNVEWAKQLWNPTTGVEVSYSDFGNSEAIGQAFSLTPFMEMDFSRMKKRLWLKFGGGIGYFNTVFDDFENPFNKGISTHLNLSFRTELNYVFARTNGVNWRAGFGLIHYSNGHNRLPNQGLNIIAFQLSTAIANHIKNGIIQEPSSKKENKREKTYYFHSRFGLGQNVLSRIFNQQKPVYTGALSFGKIINNTFKLGVGVNYRFYQHYYDYIKNNEVLVQERYSNYRNRPFWNASNIGVNVSGELLMGHIGAELDIGLNLYKPAYKIDWILNDGYSFLSEDELVTVFGELNDYFRLKRAFPTRLGLKYYIINNSRKPRHNFYLGVHINANLGQADFTEISFGYLKRLKSKEKSTAKTGI